MYDKTSRSESQRPSSQRDVTTAKMCAINHI